MQSYIPLVTMASKRNEKIFFSMFNSMIFKVTGLLIHPIYEIFIVSYVSIEYIEGT